MSTAVSKTWGHEEIIHNGAYCCKKLVYTRAISSSLHYHEKKHETFVVGSGQFELEIQGVLRIMKPGDSEVVPPLVAHRLRCVVPGTVFEASSHDDPEDCVRLVPSET